MLVGVPGVRTQTEIDAFMVEEMSHASLVLGKLVANRGLS